MENISSIDLVIIFLLVDLREKSDLGSGGQKKKL